MTQQFAKDIDSLDSVFAFLTEAARGLSVGEDFIPMLHLVVEEIFVNLVRYNTDSHNNVTVAINRTNGQLKIDLIDRDVQQYDITARPPVDTEQPIHERTPGGLGVHFARTIMDDVIYGYNNRTATITLIKKLEP